MANGGAFGLSGSPGGDIMSVGNVSTRGFETIVLLCLPLSKVALLDCRID